MPLQSIKDRGILICMKNRRTKLLILVVLMALPGLCHAQPKGKTPEHGLNYQILHTGGATYGDKIPLVVAIHGLGDSPAGFKGLLTAFEGKARVVVPAGPIPYGNGHSWFDTTIKGGKVTHFDQEQMVEAADRLALLVKALANQYPTAGKPIAMGFSQGGMLSFLLAVRHPDLLALAIPLGGILPADQPAPKTPGKTRIRALHGANDALVPTALARSSVKRLKDAGWDATIVAYPGLAHRISPEMKQQLYRLLFQ